MRTRLRYAFGSNVGLSKVLRQFQEVGEFDSAATIKVTVRPVAYCAEALGKPQEIREVDRVIEVGITEESISQFTDPKLLVLFVNDGIGIDVEQINIASTSQLSSEQVEILRVQFGVSVEVSSNT